MSPSAVTVTVAEEKSMIRDSLNLEAVRASKVDAECEERLSGSGERDEFLRVFNVLVECVYE